MEMHHAQCVFAGRMHCAVNREASRIDEVRRVDDLVAFEIDFHETRSRDFVEHHAVRVKQEVMLRAGYTR